MKRAVLLMILSFFLVQTTVMALSDTFQTDYDFNGIIDINDFHILNQSYGTPPYNFTALVTLGKNFGQRIEFGVFPKTKTNEQITYSAERINDLKVDLVTKFEIWNIRQPTVDSPYLWSGMDRVMIDFLDGTNAKMFLRITPWGLNADGTTSWYCDSSQPDKQPNEYSCVILPEYEDDFKNYIDAITTRYSGKIDKIAFSNEWTGSHFVGDEYDYVKYANWLYDITKENSPDTTVVLGAITSNPMKYVASCTLPSTDPNYLENIYYKGVYLTDPADKESFCQGIEPAYNKFLYALSNARYDAVDIHLYDDYQNWNTYINILRTLTDKPIYISEFGGPNPNDPQRTDLNYQAQELRQYINTLLKSRVSELYYFQLIEGNAYHDDSALITTDVNLNPIIKPTYDVFKHRYEPDWNYVP